MSDLFLSRIELQEFRGFGALDLQLGSEPGVMIIHGSNGLGKSSIFDAIEWALTDKVDHFPTAKAPTSHYLRRWDADADRPTNVTLHFGEQIVRRKLTGLDSAGIVDIPRFLKHPDWEKEIEHLDRYLLLTHFLGQSTVSRMTHREAKQRWEFLQEPAQSYRAVELIRGLHGHGSSAQAKAFDRRAAELETGAQNLERLLKAEQESWQDAQLEGAIDDKDGSLEERRLRLEIEDLARRLGTSEYSVLALKDNAMSSLEDLAHALRQTYESRDVRFARGRSIVEEWQRLNGEKIRLAALTREASEQNRRLAEQIAELERKVSDSSKSLQDETRKLSNAQSKGDALENFERARGQLILELTAMGGVSDLCKELTSRIQIANAQVRKSERRRAIAERLSNRRVSLAERIASFDVVLRKLRAARNSREALSNVSMSAQGAELRRDRVHQRLAALEGQSEARRRRVDNLEMTKAEAEQTFGLLSGAVATIATYLPDSAQECPVCSTPFANRQELRQRIDSAAARLAPVVSNLENELQAARNELIAADAEHKTAISEIALLDEQRAQVDTLRSDFENLLAELGISEESQLEALESRIIAESSHISFVVSRIEYWLRHPIVGGLRGALDRWTSAIEERNEIASSLAQQEDRKRLHEGRVRDTQDLVSRQAASVFVATDIPEIELDKTRRARLDEVQRLEASVVEARRYAQTLEGYHRAAKSAEVETTARLTGYDSETDGIDPVLAELKREWSDSLGFAEHSIGLQTIEEGAKTLATLEPRLRALPVEIDRLNAGRLAWSRQQRHRQVLAEMRAKGGIPPIMDRLAIRRKVEELQSNTLRRAAAVRRAKAIAHDTYSSVVDYVESFNEQFLAPLTNLMNRINRAILTDPDVGLRLKVGARKIEQRVSAAPSAPPYVSDLDPQLIHSEGQMAALAVSMLTAANLTFPWSRWRALIMDDPLQHNDMIHASAFADLMRNLVRVRRYQVLLTTHDLAQADFLRRKFQAAEIPCTAVQLLGKGSRGVDYAVERGGTMSLI
jgi:DNA repair exonuclease SbcCD ATPase subunit